MNALRKVGWVVALLATLCLVAQEANEMDAPTNSEWDEIGNAAIMKASGRGNALWRVLVQRETSSEDLAVALAAKPDVNARGSFGHTPLTATIFFGRDELAKIGALLRAGADPNGTDERGNTPLFYAIRAGNPAAVARLLQSGARQERVCLGRHSATKVAIRFSRMDAAAILIEAGGDPTETLAGWSLTHLAAQSGKISALANTREFRAQLEARGPGGLTPLMLAARNGRVSHVQSVLEYHAHVDIADDTGTTALMMAAGHGYGEAAKALLAAGANPRLRNQAGETAYVIAGRRGHRTVQEVLLASGAEAEPVWLADEAKRALELKPKQRRALVLAALDLHLAGFSIGALEPLPGEKERAETWLKRAGLTSEREWRAECDRWHDEGAETTAAPVLNETEMRAKEEALLDDPAALAAWKASLKTSAPATRASRLARYSFLMVLGARAGWIGEERTWRALERVERDVAALKVDWPAIGAAVRGRLTGRQGPSASTLQALEVLFLDEKSPTALWRLSPWQ